MRSCPVIADGRKQVRPLADGVDQGLGPLRFFPANSGFQKYRVNTQLDANCDVSIMATTTPHAYSGTSGNISATPWAKNRKQWDTVLLARCAKINNHIPSERKDVYGNSVCRKYFLSVSAVWLC